MSLQNMKALVVDDSMLTRRMLKDILSASGFSKVYEASDGSEALEQYKKLKPDLTTLDIIMPNKDGLIVLKEIMNFDPKANVVMVSSMGQEHFLKISKKLGAKYHILKPFKKEEISHIINKIFKDPN